MAIVKVQTKTGETRWRLRFYSGRDPETNKRIYLIRTFKRKKDADVEERRLAKLRDMGSTTAPSKDTLAVYLRRWHNDVMKGRIAIRTWDDYSGIIRRYIERPTVSAHAIHRRNVKEWEKDVLHVGKVRLDQLKPEILQTFYANLRDEAQLSPRTLRSIHAVIHQGLQYALETGAVARNVADLTKLPKITRREVQAMSREEVREFLMAAQESDEQGWPLTRHYALWCVLFSGGLRPSEALALKWSDYEPETGKLRIQRALTRRGGGAGYRLENVKTSRSRRTVLLSDFARDALATHSLEQKKGRLRAGAEYLDEGFIFATEFGKPLDSSNIYRRDFTRIMREAGIGEWVKDGVKDKFKPAYRMYDLRHTCATLMLRGGVNAKVVSERLGHSSVAFTMDTYAAFLPEMQEEAADVLNISLTT